MIILVNINYINLELMVIGIVSKCKVNVNIGVFLNVFDVVEEVKKLKLVVKYGVDIVMDLFIGGVNFDEVCIVIIGVFFVLIGIVFVYQVLESVYGLIEKFDEDDFFYIIEKYC